MKVGRYVRVSTSDKGQDYNVQAEALAKFCDAHGWEHELFADEQSAFKDEMADTRIQFNRMLEQARMKEINIILVYSIDRFSREDPLKVFRRMDDIVRLWSCRFISLQDGIDSNSPMWQPLMAVMAWQANNYSRLHSQRVHDGIQRKKDKHEYKGGRPRLPELTTNRILEAYNANPGISMRQLRELIPTYRTKSDCERKVSIPSIARVLHKHMAKSSDGKDEGDNSQSQRGLSETPNEGGSTSENAP